MPKSPFGSFDDDFETNPIVRATGAIAKQVAKTTTQQVKKTAQVVKGQVKGSGTSGSGKTPSDDDIKQQLSADTQAANIDPVAQTKKALTAPVYFNPAFDKNKKPVLDPNAPDYVPMGRTPEEQEQIQDLRKELYHHKQYYYDQTIGRVSDIEGDQRRKRFEREQEEMRKKQEEEEEEMRKKQEEEQEKQQLAEPQGKSKDKGIMGKGKMKKPLAVRKAQTKTETGKMTG